jgi:ATP-dependent DNA helicase PIF1
MLSLKLFDQLNEIGKAIRGNTKPFGGIQLIFSGDFFQLPPVGDKEEPDSQRFCFESKDWNTVFQQDSQIELVKIFRQTDELYSTILNQIRQGIITRSSCNMLNSYVNRKIDENLVVQPTKLLPTKMQVDAINCSEMLKLGDAEERIYQYKYEYQLPMTSEERNVRIRFSKEDMENELKYIASNLNGENILKLKVGAQVMCIINVGTNDQITLCNGSQGIITKFNESGFPVVKYNNGVEQEMGFHHWISDKIPGIAVSQIPLVLSWAITIHKSQGATLDCAEIDVGSGIFECGQTYVALSRVKSLNGLYLTSFDPSRILINKKVKLFYENLTKYYDEHPIPIQKPLIIEKNIFSEFVYKDKDISK